MDNNNNTKKRKCNNIIDYFIQPKENLSIKPIEFLKCEVCLQNVYNYRVCDNNMIYCSDSCRAILILSKKNGYLDEPYKKVARSFSVDDFKDLMHE